MYSMKMTSIGIWISDASFVFPYKSKSTKIPSIAHRLRNDSPTFHRHNGFYLVK